MEDRFVTPGEGAEIVGCDPNTLRRNDTDLGVVRSARGRRFYPRTLIERFAGAFAIRRAARGRWRP